MAEIRPFRAYRPRKGLEEQIAALPYDVYSREEAAREVEKNPHSFLAIDRPETQFDSDTDMYAANVYKKAGDMLWEQIKEGAFVLEEKPCYYLYRQSMNGRSQTGIVACASIDDYNNHVIKKHENTRADKEEDRVCHVEACNCQTGPIFLAYRSNEVCRQAIAETMKRPPVNDFQSEDGVIHQVWVMDDPRWMLAVREAFREMPSLYIADGHHRCASAVRVGMRRRERFSDYTGEEAYNYFLSVCFSEDELRIMDYNRVVKDLNGLNEKDFLHRVEESFEISYVENAYHPQEKATFGMYLRDTWYALKARPAILSKDVVRGLDVSILQDFLLGPVLGIQDPKTDNRIAFVGGIRGLKELERRVHTDMAVAFSLYPTSVSELFVVADKGQLMPPKSTWFEPKLRSGLFLHSLREEDQ